MKKAIEEKLLSAVNKLTRHQQQLDRAYAAAGNMLEWEQIRVLFAMQDVRVRLLTTRPEPTELISRLRSLIDRCARKETTDDYYRESAALCEALQQFFASQRCSETAGRVN